MDLGKYTGIIFAACFLPSVIILVGGLTWCWCRKNDAGSMLMVMKAFSRKIINGKSTYLLCGRKLPSGFIYKIFFCANSLFLISMCVQLFFLLATTDLTYTCINDPQVDCFKKKDDVKLTDTFAYHESPVNCSSISPDDFVLCYRLTLFDPERASIAAAAAYLMFKILNFGYFIVTHIMLWMAKKWRGKSLIKFKILLCLFFNVLLFVPLILRFFLDEVESAIRKIPYTVWAQSILLALAIWYYILIMPWGVFKNRKEYFGVVSLPDIESNSGSDRYSSSSESDSDGEMDDVNSTRYRYLSL